MSEFTLAMDRGRQDLIEAELKKYVLELFRRYHNEQQMVECALMFAASEIASCEGITAGKAQDHYQLEASRSVLARRKLGYWPDCEIVQEAKNWPVKIVIGREELEREIARHCRPFGKKYNNRVLARALTNVAIAVASEYSLDHFAYMARATINWSDRELPKILDEALGEDRYPATTK